MVVRCLLISFSLLAASAFAAESPYPASPVIAGVSFDFSSHIRLAPGSDNWPMTWASDGSQYTSWGDGGGFGGSNSDGRASLGVARIEGGPDDYRGINIWGGKGALAPAQFEGKSYGILAIGETLYMWVSPGSGAENNTEARLAWSTDAGRTWQRAEWAFTPEDQVMVPAFCQFGPGYQGARDDFVYLYSTRLLDPAARMQQPGRVDLFRAPKNQLRNREAYEVFVGLGADGAPRWSAKLEDRQAILEDPSGLHRLSICFNAGLGRYLLCIEHTKGYAGYLALFDAPAPWGPWTTVEYTSDWGGFGSVFYWCIPTKWLDPTGRTFTMVFTGTDDNDSLNTVQGKFLLRSKP